MTVESPGTLPGIVRLNNMREIHFSRNPKIAEFLHEYEYVREFGEGVDRMYLEMKEAGLPEPEYRTEAFMVYATIRNKNRQATSTPQVKPQVKPQDEIIMKVLRFCSVPRKKVDIVNYCGYKDRRRFTDKYLKPLLESGALEMTIPDKPNSSKQMYVTKGQK